MFANKLFKESNTEISHLGKIKNVNLIFFGGLPWEKKIS